MGFHDHPTNESKPIARESSTYLTDSEAATFCTVFGDGLESGMSYARIVDMLERQKYDNKLIGRLRQAILDDGNMLGEALARFGLLDATARKLILAAEQQGKLPSTFKDLGAHYDRRHKRRKKLISAFVEPCILFAVGFILARNLIGGGIEAVAEFTNIIEELKPIALQSLLEMGIFGSVVGLAAFAYINLPVEMGLRNLSHRLWLSLAPGFVSQASRLQAIATFCRYTEQSLASGLTVHHSLALAAEASNSPKIERRIEKARKCIEEGMTLADSLRQSRALPPEVIDYIDVGEEAGRLEERFQELTARYEEKADEAFKKARSAFIYTMRMLIVIGVIVSLMLTIGTSAADQVG